ncbi:MAG: hypothetical protein ABSB91_00310 [Sedimentisphaerales bacterium]|jgi:hypothetical protein
MLKDTKIDIGLVVMCLLMLVANLLFGSTTFTTSKNSYFGRESSVEKLTVSVVPVHKQDVNDHNDVNSTATDGNSIYGELRRITLSATGTDVNFTVAVKDDKGITLFSKTDCNTALLPLSYALDMNNSIATRYPGIYVAGPLTVETNYVDPNTVTGLTGINVTFYYQRF